MIKKLTIVCLQSNQFTSTKKEKGSETKEKGKEKEREQLIKELTLNNADLKQFSYITSHNLRAPLSNLRGLLALLEDIERIKELLK